MKEYTIVANRYPYRIVETGNGLPFVWLHGMFHSIEVEDIYSFIQFELISRHFRLIRIELPAHGRSPLPESHENLTWRSLASDIAEIMTLSGAQRYFAGGFSQGAAIAAHVALTDQRVAGIVAGMLPKIWSQRASVVRTYRKLAGQLGGGADAVFLSKVFNAVKYPPLQLGWSQSKGGAISRLMMQQTVPAMKMILEGAIRSDMPDPSELMHLSSSVFLCGWENDVNHPSDIFHEVEKSISPGESMMLRNEDDAFDVTNRIIAFFHAKA